MTAAVAPEQFVAARRRIALPRRAVTVAAIAILIALAGVWWLTSRRTSESTDNAYLRADSTAVASRVRGQVVAVLVRDNQTVRAGDPLVRIDPQDYDAAVAGAEAATANADAEVAEAEADLASLAADQRLAAARSRAAGTEIAAADAERVRATADRLRYEALAARGFATRRDAERVRAAAVGAASAAERTRADLGVTAEQAAVTRARGPVLAAKLQSARAGAARARAALALARLDRARATVLAPVAGAVGNRQVQTGDYVQAGSHLLTIVPDKRLYVVANFKETQTRAMRVGQRATVRIDALDGEALTGTVESFAPASGSDFTLLPFEPGSGNFTKIVQRVGVRIRLDRPPPAAAAVLRSGLSATVRVALR
jgi:membrane fusion protein (multidrug efflux system)